MSKTPALTDAAFPIKINGKEYFASMLSDRDYGDLTQYIRAVIIRIARDSAKDFDEVTRAEIYNAALKAAASSGWGTMEGARIISTQEGSTMLGWVLIRKRHPKVSKEAFDRECSVDLAEAIGQIDLAFTQLHILPYADEVNSENKESSTEDSKSEV